MMHFMLPTPIPYGQTHVCENITFPRLCLWVVKIPGGRGQLQGVGIQTWENYTGHGI